MRPRICLRGDGDECSVWRKERGCLPICADLALGFIVNLSTMLSGSHPGVAILPFLVSAAFSPCPPPSPPTLFITMENHSPLKSLALVLVFVFKPNASW